MALPVMEKLVSKEPRCVAKATVFTTTVACKHHACSRDVHKGQWHLCNCGAPFFVPNRTMEV